MTHLLRGLVGIGSRGQDFLDEAVTRSNTSDSNNRLNSEKTGRSNSTSCVDRKAYLVCINRLDISNFLGEEFSKMISQLIAIGR